MSERLVIPQEIIAAIAEQAVAEAPNEACGYLRGLEGRVHGRMELTNVDASPEHFTLDPQEQFAALKEARRYGEQLLAVYHSHPETPARMSDEDIRLANDPKTVYVIHSLADGRTRGFRVDRTRSVVEVPIEIVPAAPETTNPETTKEEKAMADTPIDRDLDLSGEVCPYTFVKSKLALEELDPGQVLRVTVDNSESASNVPRSLSLEGHDIVSLEQARGKWLITVRNADA